MYVNDGDKCMDHINILTFLGNTKNRYYTQNLVFKIAQSGGDFERSNHTGGEF